MLWGYETVNLFIYLYIFKTSTTCHFNTAWLTEVKPLKAIQFLKMLSNLVWSWKNICGSRDNVLPHFHATLFHWKLKLNINFIKNVRELTFLVLFKRFFKIFFISFKLWNSLNVINTGLPNTKIPGCQNHGFMERIQKYAEM